jgi:hypothetical protein
MSVQGSAGRRGVDPCQDQLPAFDWVGAVIQKISWSPKGKSTPLEVDVQGPRPRLLCGPFISWRDATTQPGLSARPSSPAWASLGITHVYDRHGYAKEMKLALDDWGARLERLAMPARQVPQRKVKT